MATIQLDTTCSVATTGNPVGLCLTLSSILAGLYVPQYLVIRHEGGAEFSSFYLEQLIDLARFRGIEVSIDFAQKLGIRATRTAQLGSCKTEWLWLADDDVIYDHRFLAYMGRHMVPALDEHPETLCYLCGAKPDINDRASVIAGFSSRIEPMSSLSQWDERANLHWGNPDNLLTIRRPMKYPDTGVMLLHVGNVAARKIAFMPFEGSDSISAAPGEDSLFGIQTVARGGQGFFIPSAQAIHLSKPASRFPESVTRAELVLRSAQCLQVPAPITAHFPPGNKLR